MKKKLTVEEKKLIFSMVKKAISTMRKRKAADKVGWKAEWIIE